MPDPIESGAAAPHKQSSVIAEKADAVSIPNAQSDTENVVPFSSGPEPSPGATRLAQPSGPGLADFGEGASPIGWR
jgi:hypothetical protein